MEGSNWLVFVQLINHSGQQYARYHWSGSPPGIHALHGFMGSGSDFSLLSQALTKELIAWDLIGHGQSSAPVNPECYSLAHQLDFLQDNISAGSILLGYSMGGRLALQFACQFPQYLKALIVIGGTPGIVEPQLREVRQKWDQQMASQIRAQGTAQFIEEWNRLPIIQSQQNIESEHRAMMLTTRRGHSEEGLANTMKYFGTGQMPHCWSKLAKMGIPVLLIVGEEDKKYTDIALQMFDLIENCSLGIIPAVGHCAHLENPTATAILINRWLRDLDHSASGSSGHAPSS